MPAITLENITDAVINHGDKGKTNPRLHQIYSSLIKHLHAFHYGGLPGVFRGQHQVRDPLVLRAYRNR